MKRVIEWFKYPGERVPVRIDPYFQNDAREAYYHCFGLMVNWRALWVGAHYSKHDKRLCLNLLPCVTLWWTRPGGKLP